MRTVAALALLVTLGPPLAAQSARFAPPVDFGAALAVRDRTVLIGRGGGALGSIYPSTGGVHLVERRGSDWTVVGQFSARDVAVGDAFGSAIAASETGVLVGAPGRREGRGAGYLFEESGGAWREAAVLDPGAEPGARAGTTAALGGDLAVLGAPADRGPGSVYVFRRTGAGYVLLTRLTSGRTSADGFGRALHLTARHLFVGAPSDSGGRGAVYVYARQSGALSLLTTIRRDGAAPGDRFGDAVVGLENGVFAGAPGANQGRGLVALFGLRPGDRFALEGEIAAAGASLGDRFGSTLTIGGELLIGAPGADQGRGALYAAKVGDPREAATTRIEAKPTSVGDRFGGQLAASSSIAAAAAPAADARTGAVAIFERGADSWRQAGYLHEPPPMALQAMTGEMARCTDGKVGEFDCSDVDLVAFLPLEAIGGKPGIIANDIWGWTDPETKREYALVGRSDGTAFVDVTDAGHPRYVGELPLHDGAHVNLWRDIKVYKDHAFIVADGAGPHGMQVFDLTQLRRATGGAPVRFRETAHYDKIASAHNIVINEATGFAFSVGSSGGGETCGGGLHMIDIRNPTAPSFAGCFAHPNTGRSGTGYSHDAQCVVYHGPDQSYRDREICMGANETALSISDVTDKTKPIAIASAAYPNVAYAHQGWLSDDHRFFYMGDEADEVAGKGTATRTLVWDVSDLDDPVLVNEYRAETHAIDHNQYVRGNYLYQSNLLAGLRILDVSDPTKPREVGFFDTVPWNGDQTGFGGSWSNYPYFASGVVAVSSWNEGLFLLKRRERPVP
ncbi:MAG: choice-of-anchor B family protein [Gemmatimonadales bacterium]